MSNTRQAALALALLLGLASLPSTGLAQSTGAFTPTGNMTTPRSAHTATLLRDGRVLIAGGYTIGGALSSAELYDPSTGMFAATGMMTVSRWGHTATLLQDGRVLIVSGSSAEIYDPSTGTFAATGNMATAAQSGQTATLLQDGTVLIAGGESYSPPWPTAVGASVYDPMAGTFTATGAYAGPDTLYFGAGGPIWPKSALLPDGTVLIAGDSTAELYDPATRGFRLTGAMNSYPYGMYWHTATALADGRVLVAGGTDEAYHYAAAELYDAATGSFTVTGSMTQGRDLHTATLLPDGRVLVAGGGEGWCFTQPLASAEVYDPATGTFGAAGNMIANRASHTATLLNTGQVLITGGYGASFPIAQSSAELFTPDASAVPGRVSTAIRSPICQ